MFNYKRWAITWKSVQQMSDCIGRLCLKRLKSGLGFYNMFANSQSIYFITCKFNFSLYDFYPCIHGHMFINLSTWELQDILGDMKNLLSLLGRVAGGTLLFPLRVSEKFYILVTLAPLFGTGVVRRKGMSKKRQIKYSWLWNTSGIERADPPHSQKSEDNFRAGPPCL